jgi:hypothetical protein
MKKNETLFDLELDDLAADDQPLKSVIPEGMDKRVKNAIQVYQCDGCIQWGSITECFEKGPSEACVKHSAGFALEGIGFVFIGLPKGFKRLGPSNNTNIYIFRTRADGWEYHKFNVPIWKHLDDNGNTIVRGICPRLNKPWIHIYLTDCLDDIDCIEISKADIEMMD